MVVASSPTLVLMLMLSVPATATAFLHWTTNQRRYYVIDRRPSHHLSIKLSNDNALDEETDARNHITELLREKQRELLSDTSKLHEQCPRSTVAADNELRGSLTEDQMVHEALLSTRLSLPFLHRSEVAPSNIEGAGRGLFAAENISKGEVITCYPGDALLYEMSCEDSTNVDDFDEDEMVRDDYEEEDEYVDEMVLWGAHVHEKDRWDEDTVFDGSESKPPLTSTAVFVDEQYSIMGHPDLDDDPAYYGHYANDGAGHLAFEKAPSQEMGVEESIARYVVQSQEVANAMHKSLGEGLHVTTVATKDIKAGEEILVTYGPDFWLGHC